MTRINTNVEALRGLRNYQKANTQLTQSLTRLSTGVKINSGRDNPSGLIAGETLKLQTTTIEQSIKNSNRANNVLSTADGALGEVAGLLNQVRGLVQEGLNVGALSQDEISANQGQIDAALNAINRISQNTTFAGDKLLDGSKAFTTSVTSADAPKLADYRINEALLGANTSISIDARITTKAEKAQLRYDGGDLTAAANIEVGGNKGSQNILLGSASTLSQVSAAINGVTDSTGVSSRVLSGFTRSVDATANTLTTALAGNNNDLVFTDARASTSQGTNASLGGSVSVVYTTAGGNNEVFGVSTAVDGDGNATITVALATDGSAAITTTAAQVSAAINQDASASKYVTAANAASNDGSGAVTALASTALSGGTDALKANFTDKRADSSAGTVSLVFVNPGSNSAALGVAVTRSGNNSTVTVNLATNASGGLTTTYDQLKTALEANNDAKNIVDIDLNGDGSKTVAALASTNLQASTGTLVLESSGFGSDQFVNVNVLSGSFATVKEDGTTAAGRDTGTNVAAIINGQQVEGLGLSVSVRTATLDAALSFASSANEVGNTASVSVTGGGSLFQIGEDATTSGQIGIGIEAINTSRLGGITGKLYELGTGGGRSLQDVKASLDGSGANVNQQDLVDIIDQSLTRVSALRGRIGSLQRNVIETNISTLGVALENITEARSQIVDTDFAAETASLQKAQVLTQAGISVLGIANQNPQQVLSLLR